jgi:chromosome condensin MukBEF complex kleisin-like MukF subunit
MRRWYVPLTVLGLGGISAFLLSQRGRTALRAVSRRFQQAPGRLLELNESLQSDLDRIQTALDRIADSLDPHPEAGH